MREFQAVKQNSDLMHQYNMKMLYKLIKNEKVTTKANLTRITKLSPTSIGRLVGELIEDNYVTEVGVDSGGLGRKATLLQINENRILTVGLSIDRGIIKAGVVNLFGEQLLYIERKIDEKISKESLVLLAADMIQYMIDSGRESYADDLIGIGISVPGLVTWPNGIMQYSPQFRWGNCNMREELNRKLNRNDIFVENNVKAMAVAEHVFGDLKDNSDFIILNVGSGVGAAVMSQGSLLRGARNFVGEIGHTIIDTDGPICDCGRKGCFQTFVSMDSIEKKLGLPFCEVIQKSRKGNSEVNLLLDHVTDKFAIMTANLVNYYDINTVIYQGAMQQEWEEMVGIIADKTKKYLWKALSSNLEIIAADIESDVVAASSVIFNEFLATNSMELT